MQLDHPLLVLLLLDAGDLLQLTGPFALQHLIKQREIKLNSGIFFLVNEEVKEFFLPAEL